MPVNTISTNPSIHTASSVNRGYSAITQQPQNHYLAGDPSLALNQGQLSNNSSFCEYSNDHLGAICGATSATALAIALTSTSMAAVGTGVACITGMMSCVSFLNTGGSSDLEELHHSDYRDTGLIYGEETSRRVRLPVVQAEALELPMMVEAEVLQAGSSQHEGENRNTLPNSLPEARLVHIAVAMPLR